MFSALNANLSTYWMQKLQVQYEGEHRRGLIIENCTFIVIFIVCGLCGCRYTCSFGYPIACTGTKYFKNILLQVSFYDNIICLE